MDAEARYAAAVAVLDARIDPVGPADRRLSAIWARAEAKRERARDFLHYLGDPHQAYRVVHVTGTSGKGSTSAMIAAGLSAAGFRTGLATSPYLQLATEKLQIDGRLIGPGSFADVVTEVLGAADAWSNRGADQVLSYGELWMAVQSLWFARERVAWAVIEVGAGGRFDVTNVVSPALSVITSVGLDHTQTLGPTIRDIAWHKAGIIKPHTPVISAGTDPVAASIIAGEAADQQAPLTSIDSAAIAILGKDAAAVTWRPATGPPDQTFRTRPAVNFQARNGYVALLALRRLRAAGHEIPEDAIAAGLWLGRMPGRAERMPTDGDSPVLLDAAHNPDKITALVAELGTLLPGQGQKPVLVTGMLEGKDAGQMLALLLPVVGAVVTTAVSVPGKESQPPERLASRIRATGFPGAVIAERDPGAALGQARRLAGDHGGVLITGSMYLIGRLREEWYPSSAILKARTPWPAQAQISSVSSV